MTIRLGFEVVAPDLGQVDTSASAFLCGATGLSGLRSGPESTYLTSSSPLLGNRPLITVSMRRSYVIIGKVRELQSLCRFKHDQTIRRDPGDFNFRKAQDGFGLGGKFGAEWDALEPESESRRGHAHLYVSYVTAAEKFSRQFAKATASLGAGLLGGAIELPAHALIEAGDVGEDLTGREKILRFFLSPRGTSDRKTVHRVKGGQINFSRWLR